MFCQCNSKDHKMPFRTVCDSMIHLNMWVYIAKNCTLTLSHHYPTSQKLVRSKITTLQHSLVRVSPKRHILQKVKTSKRLKHTSTNIIDT